MAKKAKVQSLKERLAERIDALKPKKGDAGEIEVSMDLEKTLANIKYVLDLGIPSFDDLAGRLPFGRMVEIFGLEGCGKTALCVRAAVRAQQGHIYAVVKNPDGTYTHQMLDPKTYNITVLYFDQEGSLDTTEKRMVDGVLMTALETRCNTVDLFWKALDTTMKEMAVEEASSGKLQLLLVICDTVAATNSAKALSQEWGSEDYAREPKQWHTGFRNMAQEMSRRNVLFLGTNQVGDKMGAATPGRGMATSLTPDPNKYNSPGGKALKYFATMRVFVFPMLDYKWTLLKDAQFPAGVLIGFKTLKSRFVKPFREGRMVLLYDEKQGGLRGDFSVLESMLFLHVAERDKGDPQTIVFKFKNNEVPLKTFGANVAALQQSLEDQDDTTVQAAVVGAKPAKERYKDPRITSRAEWPKMYREHRADFDALWTKAVHYAMTIEGLIEEAIPVAEAPEITTDEAGESPLASELQLASVGE